MECKATQAAPPTKCPTARLSPKTLVLFLVRWEFPEPASWLTPVFTRLPCPAPNQGGARPTPRVARVYNTPGQHQHSEASSHSAEPTDW